MRRPKETRAGYPLPEQIPPGMQDLATLKQLGFLQDPTSQAMGLTQLLNELDKPDQVQQEMALRTRGLDQSGEQFQQSLQVQKDGLHRQETQDTVQADQWLQQFLSQKALGEGDLKVRQDALANGQKDDQLKIALGLAGVVSQSAAASVPVNTDVAGAQISQLMPGLAGLYAPIQSGPVFPQPNQNALYQTRVKLGLPPLPNTK